MDYLKFYELEIEPFRNEPEPKFFFEGRAQRSARMRILRGVRQRKGLSVLVGGPGLGKTTLARHLLGSLDDAHTCVRLIQVPHRACDAGWLLPRIAAAFGVAQPGATPLAVLGQVYERLSMLVAAGRAPVLLVDEAQLLANVPAMEEFRALLNLEAEDRKVLSLVLFGLPELDAALRLDLPLAQRVDVRAQMTGLEADEIGPYLVHRLKLAGRRGELFSADAIGAFHGFTCGIPRLVNTLADNALFEGSLVEAREIDLDLVRTAAEQLGLVSPPPPPPVEAVEPEAPVAARPASPGRADWLTPPAPEPADVVPPRTARATPAAAPRPVARPTESAAPAARSPLPRPAPIPFEPPSPEPSVDPGPSEWLVPTHEAPPVPIRSARPPVAAREAPKPEPLPRIVPAARPAVAPASEPDLDIEVTDDVALELTGSEETPLPFLDPEPSSETQHESLADLLADELDSGEREPITEATPHGLPAAPRPSAETVRGGAPPAAPAAPAGPAAPEAPAGDSTEDEFLLDALFDEIQVRR